MGDDEVVPNEGGELRVGDERVGVAPGGLVAGAGNNEEDRTLRPPRRFDRLVERIDDPRGGGGRSRGDDLGLGGLFRERLGHVGNPGSRRLPLVTPLLGELRAVRADQKDRREVSHAVFDADLRAFHPDGFRDPVLGEVDHQENDVLLGPFPESARIEDVFLECFAVRAPVAAGEHGQDRPAGLLGLGDRAGVAGVPSLVGHLGGGRRGQMSGKGSQGRERRQGDAGDGAAEGRLEVGPLPSLPERGGLLPGASCP